MPSRAPCDEEGTRVGIVGLGGLGVIGIKIAVAMGCVVTAVSRSAGKEGLARKAGATHFVSSDDAEAMRSATGSLDLILNTIPASHDWVPFQRLLRSGGQQVQASATIRR